LLSAPIVAAGALVAFGVRRLIARRPPDAPANPSDLGLTYEPVAFSAADGMPLRGWFLPAHGPARGALIFLHGQAGSMDGDIRYAPACVARGYHVLMFDFRAHGRSGGDWVSFGYYERLDVLAAIAFLRTRGIEQVGLWGFSMGGAVALVSAPLTPAVRAIVSDGGFARLETTVAGWLGEKGAPRPVRLTLARAIILAAGLRLGCWLPAADPIRWVSRVAPAGIFFMQGGSDPYVPLTDARRLFALAGEPKQIWVEPAAGHREIELHAPADYVPQALDFFDRFFPESSR
jgi:pimeloyl-ACP methyl ester carboxylesterase